MIFRIVARAARYAGGWSGFPDITITLIARQNASLYKLLYCFRMFFSLKPSASQGESKFQPIRFTRFGGVRAQTNK